MKQKNELIFTDEELSKHIWKLLQEHTNDQKLEEAIEEKLGIPKKNVLIYHSNGDVKPTQTMVLVLNPNTQHVVTL